MQTRSSDPAVIFDEVALNSLTRRSLQTIESAGSLHLDKKDEQQVRFSERYGTAWTGDRVALAPASAAGPPPKRNANAFEQRPSGRYRLRLGPTPRGWRVSLVVRLARLTTAVQFRVFNRIIHPSYRVDLFEADVVVRKRPAESSRRIPYRTPDRERGLLIP